MQIIKRMLEQYKNSPIVLKASLWFLICSFLQKGISVLTTPIFSRLLSTYEYGKYVLFFTWSDVMGILITFCLATSVYQKKYIEIDSEEIRNEFTSSMISLCFILATISFSVYIVFRNIINGMTHLTTSFIVAIYISNVMKASFEFWALRQRVNFKYIKLVFLTLVTTILKPLIGILLILLFPEYKVEARVFSIVAVEFLFFFPLAISQLIQGRRFVDKRYWKYALSYVIPLIPHYLSQRVLSQSDRVMIETMVGTSSAGIYGLVYSAGSILNMLIAASEGTVAPWIYTKIKEEKFDRIYDITKYPLFLFWVVCVAYLTVSPEVIRIFAPPEYLEGIIMMPAFITVTFLMFIYSLFVYVEYYYEKTSFIMAATLISALVNIILNYIFISEFGYCATAYSTLLCYIIYAYAHYKVMRHICKEKEIESKLYDSKLIVLLVVGLLCYGMFINVFSENLAIRYLIVGCLIIIGVIKKELILAKIKEFKEQ